MKQLVGVCLVEWFLYEKRHVKITPKCGVFGANGSGKSSILDAVQTVMLGASAHRGHGVVFNAQADEKKSTSTRTIRAYCLGQYDVTEGARVRDDSTTYITLVWQDTKTRELISTGVCISASSQREEHTVLGRYIFRSELTLGDHLQLVDGEERARDWPSFREQLRQRSGSNDDPLFHDAERFVKALLLALRGDGGVAQIDAFRQAFRFGLKMGFDKSIDEIVRHQVIEARPTNVQKFRDNFNLWKQVQATVAETSEKVKSATVINDHYEAAIRLHRRAVTWPALGKAVGLEAANSAVTASEEAEAKALQKKDQADEAMVQAEAAAVSAERDSLTAASKRDTHAAHTQQQLATQEMTAARKRSAEIKNELRGTLNLLRSRLNDTLAGTFEFKANGAVRQACQAVANMLTQLDGATRDTVESVTRQGLRAAKQLSDELFDVRRSLGGELTRAQAEVADAQADLARSAEGKAPLEGPAKALRALLLSAGIDATPVCDLVDIDDADWQPVIEAYLGVSTLQTLLIESGPRDEARAYQIYKESSVFGAKVASSTRHEDRRSPVPGSVSELIRSKSSPAAANYLRSKFGGCMRASDERSSFAHPSTLTVDGMLFRDGELDRLRPVSPGQFRIGPVTAGTKAALRATLEGAQARVEALEKQDKAAKVLFDNLALVAGDVDSRVAHLMGLFDNAETEANAAASAQARLDDLATSDYHAVKVAAENAATLAGGLRSKATQAATAAGAAKTVYEQRQEASRRALVAQGEADALAKAARQVADFDPDYYSEHWERLVVDMQKPDAADASLSALQVRCVERAGRASSESNSKAGDGNDALIKYLFDFTQGEHLPEAAREHWTLKAKWIQERKLFLESTELPTRQKEASAALDTARSIFRNDVAVHINERLEWLVATFDRMNEALRMAPPFTNGERYLFKRVPRPQYAALHKFILDVAQYGPSDDLLGGAGDVPPEFDRLMRDQTDPDAKATISPLDDYREFFEFDVQILREDPVTGVRRQVGMLSQRVGPGSGGEHRAPLYVMAGAALASAYHAKPGDDSGIRLIVLDEAFTKMDPNNIAATMQYLDQLGLQVVMASTGDTLGTLSAFLDRYYDIMRDPYLNIVVLEGHDMDQKARDMFRSDMVEFHPELIEQEMERLRVLPPSAGAAQGASI